MKNRRSDFIAEDISEKIKEKPLDHEEIARKKRSKWIKWLLKIVDTIWTFFT